MLKLPRIVFIGLALALAAAQSVAQISSSTGAVQGAATDPQNAAIPGAKVVLTNMGTGAVTESRTQSDGSFVFPLLAPGLYKIQVQAPGFETTEIDNVQ